MKKVIVLAAALALAGCATNAQVREAGPIDSYMVAESPEEVRDCIVGNSPLSNNASPYKSGWLVSSTANRNITSFAEIERVGGVTSVKLFTLAINRAFRDEVSRCMKQMKQLPSDLA